VLRTIAELTPDDPEAWRNYGVTLATSGSMEVAAAVLEKTVALHPSSSDYLSNYIYVLDMLDSATLEQTFQARRDWNARHALPLAALIQPHANRPDPERRLRVGYVSADFRRHSAAATFLAILQHHDPAVMEVVCYSNNLYEDDLTERFKACASVWRRVGALSDDELAAQIRADRVDVLVDLSGHSRGNRLLTFARKPAPVQVTGWGYATGTGLDAIDAFMADPVVVPPEEERFYAERVVHLPNVVCYSPPPAPPAISLLPALANGYVTFGSFNRVVKITPAVLALWAQVLLAVPGSRLVLKPSLQDTPATRERLVGPLTQRGIDAARVDILGTSPHHEHLTSFGTIDVQLDPFPHTGGVSTLDGLLMGVPCVTLLGERVAGRLTASFQRLLGLDDLIARTPEEYVEIAVGLAVDLDRWARERATLRERLLASPICDADAYARAVEAAYRGLWRDWCARWARGEDRAARSATTSEDSE
jgi:predicted O-linked N-acetylglucosamine transferase (SPINDLY family)